MEIRQEVVELSIEVAEKIIKKTVSKEDNAKIIDESLTNLKIMKPNKLAKLYSNILFECAKDMSVLDEIRDSISKIDDLVRSNADLKSFVQSKRFSKEDKLKILDKVLGSSIHGLVLGIVSYLSGMQTNKTIGLIRKYYHERIKISVIKYPFRPLLVII